MRFLFLTQYFPPEVGAAQVRLGSVTSALTRLGHEVRVVTALPNYPTGAVFPEYRGGQGRHETLNGVDIRRTWILPVQSGGFSRMLSYLSFQASSFWSVFWTCLRWRPDYLFIESPPLFLGATGLIVRKLLGTRLIFNVADLWPDVAAEFGIIRRDSLAFQLSAALEKRVYAASAAVNIVVDFMRDALLKKQVPAAKIRFLPNGVDTQLFRPDRPADPATAIAGRLGDLRDKKIVLYAGTHGKVHNLTAALDAARLLDHRQDVVFLFVGDGAEKPRLLEYARQQQLRNVVFWEPIPLTDIADLLPWTAIALSVASVSARPAKIFPAMAAGKPLIYAGVGEGADLVGRAGAGLVVAPDDAIQIAAAIERVLDDDALATKLGTAGRALAVKSFDWQVLVATWLRDLEGSAKEHR